MTYPLKVRVNGTIVQNIQLMQNEKKIVKSLIMKAQGELEGEFE